MFEDGGEEERGGGRIGLLYARVCDFRVRREIKWKLRKECACKQVGT